MVDIRKAFPRKYMSALDLEGGRLSAQRVAAEMVTFKTGEPALMLTLHHKGAMPKLVRCNQTNRSILAGVWGSKTDGWLDKKIELSVEPTSMGPGIRMWPIIDSRDATASSGDAPRPDKPSNPVQRSRIEDDGIAF